MSVEPHFGQNLTLLVFNRGFRLVSFSFVITVPYKPSYQSNFPDSFQAVDGEFLLLGAFVSQVASRTER